MKTNLPAQKPSSIPEDILRQLIAYAHQAPSVHNTQPWQFRIRDNIVEVQIASERVLVEGDPTKRELWLSLGACIENLFQAATVLGLKIIDASYNFSASDGNFAQLALSKKVETKNDQRKLDAINNRHSDRRVFLEKKVPKPVLREIESSAAYDGIRVVVTTDLAIREKTANLVAKGMTLALSSPDFRQELNHLVHVNWSPAKLGLHGYVLNQSLLGSICEKLALKAGLGIKKHAKDEATLFRNGPALIFVFSKGDVPEFWFTAGRAYEAALLKATELGLAQSTSAAVVEAADFHEDVEKLLGTTMRLQAIVRVGYVAKPLKRHSPRLPLEAVLLH